MNAPAKAVFLSYASQDAGAARHICDALRAAGIDVWFDQSELRGGDAWDASIRRKIKECALFIPVISATTNARSEGYFRLEWKLAVERSHLMAEDQPFLLPVAIDDSSEQGARVPDAFRARQWTKLPGGETPRAFVDHVKRMLDESVEAAPAPQATRPAQEAPPPEAPRKRWRVPVAVGAALLVIAAGLMAWAPWKKPAAVPAAGSAVPGEPSRVESIAVLPFANLSKDKENEFFSDGITEEILNTLSRVPGLRVSARTASFAFKGKETTTREIAAKLGVSYIVEGSVRRSGNEARIIVQLVKGDDGFQVWSETYTRDVKDIFAVQGDVALRVAGALKLRFGTGTDEKLAAGATRIPAAYDAYLRGQEAWNRRKPDDLRDAARHLNQAVALDPGFALAHGTLAQIYIEIGNDGVEPRDKAFPLAKASAERALKLDERIVQAHNAMGEYAFHYAWEWEESDRHMRRALAIDPNYYLAISHLGNHDMARNRLDSALSAARTSKELNPLASPSAMLIALTYGKRFDEAIRLGRQAIAEQPAYTFPRVLVGMAQVLSGQREEGLRAIEEFSRKNEHDARILSILGWSYGTAGQKDKARATLKKLEDLARTRSVPPNWTAQIHVALGERDRAFELLEAAYEKREPSMPFVPIDPAFDPIRGDPRFRSLLKRMKMDAYFPEMPAR